MIKIAPIRKYLIKKGLCPYSALDLQVFYMVHITILGVLEESCKHCSVHSEMRVGGFRRISVVN